MKTERERSREKSAGKRIRRSRLMMKLSREESVSHKKANMKKCEERYEGQGGESVFNLGSVCLLGGSDCARHFVLRRLKCCPSVLATGYRPALAASQRGERERARPSVDYTIFRICHVI